MATRMEVERYGLTETKDRFSALTLQANATGRPFVVLKGGKPWVEVRPLAARKQKQPGMIAIAPLRRDVVIADLDELFEGYVGEFQATEDGFSMPTGAEEL